MNEVHPTAIGGLRLGTLVIPDHRPWLLGAWFFLAAFVVFAGLAAIDTRTLSGVSVWTKPAKFSLSIAVYFFTFVLMARWLPARFWASLEGRALTLGTLAVSVAEVGYIAWMGARGEASHFNVSTPMTSVAYSLMGAGAAFLVLACAWFAVRIAHAQPQWRRDPMLLAVVLGLMLTLVLGGGFGAYLGGQSSHWVGGAQTDAGGLPGFGWSRTGGDLRVAHFFGMHAMQALPLFVLLPGMRRVGFVLLAAVGYAAVSSWTFIAAVNGAPLIP